MAKHERIHVSCEVLANPKDGGAMSLGNGYQGNGLRFEWVFNSSSERIDLPQDRVQVSGSRSLAEHMPKVCIFEKLPVPSSISITRLLEISKVLV